MDGIDDTVFERAARERRAVNDLRWCAWSRATRWKGLGLDRNTVSVWN